MLWLHNQVSVALQTDYLSVLARTGFTIAVCQIASITSSLMDTANFDTFCRNITIWN